MATFSSTINVSTSLPTGTGMAAVVTYNGVAATYTQTGARNLGNYVDPEGAFTQMCLVAPRQDNIVDGLNVMFRPDFNSTRREVVFELGDPFNGWDGTHLGAYTVDIYDNGVLLTTQNVPLHYMYSRWRWQSSPRPIRKTPAQIIATGKVPYYSKTNHFRFRNTTNSESAVSPPYTIMTFSNINRAMNAGGEGADIGILDGWSADWLCMGNAQAAANTLTHGECAGTMQIYVRDWADGGPLDCTINWPNVLVSSSQGGNPWVRLIPTTYINWDTGHQPSLSHMPFLMTGDPYFLEGQQFQANYCLISGDKQYRYKQHGRYHAWPLRELLYAAIDTPPNVPSWLLPKSVFDQHIESNRAYQQTLITNPARNYYLFCADEFGLGQDNAPAHIPLGCGVSPWQSTYQCMVMGMLVQNGYPWDSVLAWKVSSEINRLDGTMWPRAYPTVYNMAMCYTANLAVACTAASTTLTFDGPGREPLPPTPFTFTIGNETLTCTNKTAAPVWTVTRGTNAAAYPIGKPAIGPQCLSWDHYGTRAHDYYPAYVVTDPSDPAGRTTLYHGTFGACERGAAIMACVTIALRAGITACLPGYDWINSQYALWVTASWSPPLKWAIAMPPAELDALRASL